MINTMKRRGFTLIELMVVIVVMGALLILNVVNLRGTQVSARDAERKTDVETIILHLDTYYQIGSDTGSGLGRYPSTVLSSSSASYMQQTLRDIDTSSLSAPGITDPTQTFISATNNTQTTAGVTPQPTISQYVYQPIQNSGALCTAETQECRKFNIYYKLETATTDCPGPSNICLVTGKNQ
ncbi:MAG: type II secretion system protein [Candidatus Saccharibacteria bacterium]